MKLTLPAHQPFNFYNTVRSHGWYQMAPFNYDEDAPADYYVENFTDILKVPLLSQEKETL